MDKNIMLHYLRNPYGIDETELRKARLQAADELERFYINAEVIVNSLDRIIELSRNQLKDFKK